jgi:hypothetical protein
MNNNQLATMTWENALHGWRTPAEIAADESMEESELMAVCEANLTEHDLGEVQRWARVNRFAAERGLVAVPN